MSFADAFDVPLTEVVGGTTYTLPFLTVADHAALSREIMAERKATALAATSLEDRNSRADIEAYYASTDLDVDELGRLAITLPGAVRIIMRSVARSPHAGNADTLIRSIVVERGYRGVVSLAIALSAIGPRPKKAQPANPTPASAPSSPHADAASQASGDHGTPSSAVPSADATPAD